MTRIVVNGTAHDIENADDHPLLWVLREQLRLPGTKFGCGIGQCGACTVHMNGQPVRSCQLTVAQVAGTEITTVEGLSSAGEHPVQQAWIEEQVPQCGYCQSGQIMSAAALLSRTPDPTDEDIDVAMSGNICRCGAYDAIRAAIHRAGELAAGSVTTEEDGEEVDRAGGDR
jgi:aerobic-type carbon monoxide dehydrogenase small subunit (CoxS/CutS family)